MATSTLAPIPKTRRPSPRPPLSAAASSSHRSTRSAIGCPASTCPATGPMSWCPARSPIRSNRALAQGAGQYACALSSGGTSQIDAQGNSSTATKGRITGFGGAPNMGADPRGRRHDSPTWLLAGQEAGESLRGRKLVVQMVQTHQPNGAPSFVERLDAFDLAASAGFALPPIMIYGDDVTRVICDRGLANPFPFPSP